MTDLGLEDAVIHVAKRNLLDRAEAVRIIARAFCRSAMRHGGEDLECFCQRLGVTCSAPVIYRVEAVAAVLALEDEGFVVVKMEIEDA